MTCNNTLRASGKPSPRTCADCGLGPCKILVAKEPAPDELEVVGEVRAKSDAYGGTFVLWKKLPVAGIKLVDLASAQAAVAAQRKQTDNWLNSYSVERENLLHTRLRVINLEGALEKAIQAFDTMAFADNINWLNHHALVLRDELDALLDGGKNELL